jgi:hypothetical protein
MKGDFNEAPERDDEEDRDLPFDEARDPREKGDDDGQEYGDPRDQREEDEIGDGL